MQQEGTGDKSVDPSVQYPMVTERAGHGRRGDVVILNTNSNQSGGTNFIMWVRIS